MKIIEFLVLGYPGIVLLKKAMKNPEYETAGLYGFLGGILIIVAFLVLLL